MIDTKPSFQPFGFAGAICDHHPGLTIIGARDHYAQVGRWAAKDPIKFEGGMVNLYGGTFNDPVDFIGPNGLEGCRSKVGNDFLHVNSSVAGTVARQVTAMAANMYATNVVCDGAMGGSICSGIGIGSKFGVWTVAAVFNASMSAATWAVGAGIGSLVNAMKVPGFEGTIRD